LTLRTGFHGVPKDRRREGGGAIKRKKGGPVLQVALLITWGRERKPNFIN